MYNDYAETAAEMKRQSEGPKRFLQGAAKLGATAIGTAAGAASFPLLSKIAPFLSQYIPEDLAIKGLSKLSPKLGKFISEAESYGFDFNKVKEFLGKQIQDSQEAEQSQEPAKENRNIIEQYDPELHTYINDQLKKGVSLLNAGNKALSHKRFKDAIDKMKKDHKMPWESILRSVYGMGKNSQENKVASQQPELSGNPAQVTNQPGQGQQTLSAIMQKINERLG